MPLIREDETGTWILCELCKRVFHSEISSNEAIFDSKKVGSIDDVDGDNATICNGCWKLAEPWLRAKGLIP